MNLKQTFSESRTLRFVENYYSYYSIVFSSIYSAVYNFSFVQAGKHLNLNYKQAVYRYRIFTEKVLDKLMEKGVRNIEDLL